MPSVSVQPSRLGQLTCPVQVLNARVRFVGGRDASKSTNVVNSGSTGSTLTSLNVRSQASRKSNGPIAVPISRSQVNDNGDIELGTVPLNDVSLLHIL